MISNRLPPVLSAESLPRIDQSSPESQSLRSHQNGYAIENTNQERALSLPRSYGQLSNQRMYQGAYEPRYTPAEVAEAPVMADANLYIKNIDYDISDENLYTVFSKFGEITSHHIVRDTMKRSRGFGFMSYRTIDQANKAIKLANGIFIGNKPVVVMLHIKKDQRRMQKLVMKETMGSTMLPRPGGGGVGIPHHLKLQHAMHQHQSNLLLEGSYGLKGRLNLMGHQIPGSGSHTPGLHTPGHHTPGGGYGGLYNNSNPNRHSYANELLEYQREYESNASDHYMQRRSPYAQDVSWDSYGSHTPQTDSESYSQSAGSTVPQTPATHYFPPNKMPTSPRDMYGPMMALEKRQRAALLRNEMLDASRSGTDRAFDSQMTRLPSNGRNNGLYIDSEEYPQSPPFDSHDPSQWLDLTSPANANHDQDFSPASWSSVPGSRGGGSGSVSSSSYEGSYAFSPTSKPPSTAPSRTSLISRERENLTLSSNQSSMIDQLPEIVSRRNSITNLDRVLDRTRQQSPGSLQFSSDRPFSSLRISGQTQSLSQSQGQGQGQSQGQSAFSPFSLAEPGAQRSLLSSRLLPLVEAKSSQARKITDYLVANAPYNELQQLLDTPDLLLPHYIAAALDKMGG